MSSKGSTNTGVSAPQSKPSFVGSIPPKAWLYIIGVPIVIGGAYFGVVRPILRKIGALQTDEDKALEKINDLVEKQPFWSRSYYLQQNNGVKPLTETQATHYSNEIWDATRGGWTGWGTDEEKIQGAIRNIGSKAGISQVAEKFWNTRQADLLGVLKDELSDDYFATYVTQPISTYA